MKGKYGVIKMLGEGGADKNGMSNFIFSPLPHLLTVVWWDSILNCICDATLKLSKYRRKCVPKSNIWNPNSRKLLPTKRAKSSIGGIAVITVEPADKISFVYNCMQTKLRGQYIYVICRPGGPYWEKLCQRSWARPKAAGLGPYSRPNTDRQVPIRTDRGRKITCLFFSSVENFVSSFCVEFSLQTFSNLVYACVWHLGSRKSNQHYTHSLSESIIVCFLGHYWHFAFFAVKKKLLEKVRKVEN